MSASALVLAVWLVVIIGVGTVTFTGQVVAFDTANYSTAWTVSYVKIRPLTASVPDIMITIYSQ